MAETNNASDHSLLWGYPIEFWDRFGVRALVWGAILGVVALLLTSASAYILYRVADVAQKDLEGETKSSAERIAELSTQSEQLRKDTAEANARAAEARLELEKFKRPRSISVEQRNRLAEAMKQFAGQQYFGMVASDVADAWDIWREISLSLELAGWKRLPPPGLQVSQYGPPAGIPLAPQAGVMILGSAGRSTPEETMATHERAKILATKLTEESIVAGPGFSTEVPANTIVIIIGPKP